MLIRTLAFSLLSLAACATAHATTRVLDNIGADPLTGSTNANSIGVSFVTGTTAMTVDDVAFPQITQATASSPQVDSFSTTETFNIYANNPVGNTPILTASLGSFSLAQVANLVAGNSGFGQTTAVPNSTLLLSASTRYWLVLTDSSTVYWDYTSSSSYASALGVTLPADNTSYKTVGTTTTYFPLASGPQQFVLDATNAIPEPSTYCLMAVVGLAFVVGRKRSSRIA